MSEVRFVGGPLDGATREFPGDVPPGTIEVTVMVDPETDTDSTDELYTVKGLNLMYRTVPSPADDGPLWISVWVPEDSVELGEDGL